MNYNKTDDEKYNDWLLTASELWQKGWRVDHGWIFISPSGSKHDLSCADLKQLERIEREKIFEVTE